MGELELEDRQSAHAEKLALRVDDLMDENPKLSEVKAIDMAEKELGKVPGKVLDEANHQKFLGSARKELKKQIKEPGWFATEEEKRKWEQQVEGKARKLAQDEGYEVSEKETGWTEKTLKPLTDTLKKSIREKFKNMSNGPEKVKAVEEEVRNQGYNPETW